MGPDVTRFDDKQEAREWVWDLLQEESVARFPFPPHGRIPNFAGAERAAERLFEVPFWQGVERIKVNPDAILRDLGHPLVPVATSVHPLQVVEALPAEKTDLPLAWIVTPDEVIEVDDPPPPPTGIDWERLEDRDLEEMPVLARVREKTARGS